MNLTQKPEAAKEAKTEAEDEDESEEDKGEDINSLHYNCNGRPRL
jgi:hypothetical protein